MVNDAALHILHKNAHSTNDWIVLHSGENWVRKEGVMEKKERKKERKSRYAVREQFGPLLSRRQHLSSS